MSSIYKTQISDSKRYANNATKTDKKLIFRDDQRHSGDLHEEMLNIALQEKQRGDSLTASQMCNQLLEEMNRTALRERRTVKYATERNSILN